ncbi:MAG: hypothetical protein ACRETI_02800 [Steroidobacteraceae bacterium]
MGPPSKWNRSRATALGVTLLLHAILAAWLLALRFELPPPQPAELDVIWLPAVAPPPRRPGSVPVLPLPRPAPITVIPRPEPAPKVLVPPFYDFEGTAKDVAAAIGSGPGRRTFGDTPEAAPRRPKEEISPSIWPKPLPRVGTTVTTTEGETILWVSDYCYISLYSRSLTMQEIHQGRQGVRTCILYQFGGKKKARDDLFDSIKRPPKPQQEPGCGPDGIGLSCGR